MTVIRYNVERMQSVAESMAQQSTTLGDNVETAWSKLADVFQTPDFPVAIKTSANLQELMTDTIRMLAKLLVERDLLPQNLQKMAHTMQTTDQLLAGGMQAHPSHTGEIAE